MKQWERLKSAYSDLNAILLASPNNKEFQKYVGIGFRLPSKNDEESNIFVYESKNDFDHDVDLAFGGVSNIKPQFVRQVLEQIEATDEKIEFAIYLGPNRLH